MKKIYITGMAGSGKSTLANELKKRGINAIDLDEVEGLCTWRDNLTGEEKDYYPGIGREWLEKHDWQCNPERIEEIIDSNNYSEQLVLVGVIGNQNEFLHLFDQIFLLQIDDTILLDRLKNRKTNEFAQDRSEQEYLIDIKESFEKQMLDSGAIPISANQSSKQIVNQLLKKG